MHYEQLQTADTLFKHMNHYRYLNNQIANCFMNNTYYSQWKTSQNILKNIQQEHRFRKSNTLTVNETQLKTKQFLFNIIHLVALIHSTFRSLQRQKLHFLTVKQNSSSYKQKSLQIFQGKIPSSVLSLLYLNYTRIVRDPPTCDFRVSPNLSASSSGRFVFPIIFCVRSSPHQ